MTENAVNDEPIRIESKSVSFEEKFWLEYGLASLKAVVPALNDTLSKLLVVDTAVIGGGLTLIDKAWMPTVCKILMLACAWTSLSFALYGLVPRGRTINLLDPTEIRDVEREVIDRKSKYLERAALLLVCGFIVGIFGAAISAF